MKGKILLAICGGIGATAVAAGGIAFAPTFETVSANKPVASAECAWIANDGDTNLIVVTEGPEDCADAFRIISDTGFNWNTTNPRVSNGTIECRLTNDAEYLWIYELDLVANPLTSDGNSMCGALEKAGWTQRRWLRLP
jgi:hypothetical protein